jgi:hypothetical protein
MKYKRRIMASVFALSMLAGGSTVYASDFEKLKTSEFKTQVQMKSQNKDKRDENRRKKISKKFSPKLNDLQV